MNPPTYGLWLLFGIVLAPLYLMLAGWVFGRPREVRLPLVGMFFMVGLTALAWGGMAIFALVLGAASG